MRVQAPREGVSSQLHVQSHALHASAPRAALKTRGPRATAAQPQPRSPRGNAEQTTFRSESNPPRGSGRRKGQSREAFGVRPAPRRLLDDRCCCSSAQHAGFGGGAAAMVLEPAWTSGSGWWPATRGEVAIGYPAKAEGVSDGAAFLAEVIFTFALCHTVLHVATSSVQDGNSYYGLVCATSLNRRPNPVDSINPLTPDCAFCRRSASLCLRAPWPLAA